MRRTKKARRLLLETLEDRRVLATFSSVGSVLNLDLDQSQERVSISANQNSYSFTLSESNWTGQDDGNASGDGTSTLTVTADGKTTFDRINITDSNYGTSVVFSDSDEGLFSNTINIQLDLPSANGISFNGTTSFVADASLTASTTRDIRFQTNSKVSSVNGDISLSANYSNTHESARFTGLVIDDSELKATGTGNIQLLVHGGSSNLDSNYGMAIWGDSLVSTSSGTIDIQASGGGSADSYGNHGVVIVGNAKFHTGISGQINISGTGGSVFNYDNIGVIVCGSSEIESLGGPVAIAGTGGGRGPASYWNMGVKVCESAEINLTGDASLRIDGYGGSSDGKENYGSYIRDDASISSENGTITINGTGGSSNDDSQEGVLVDHNAVVQTFGTGNVEINGYGGGLGTSVEHRGVHIDGDAVIRATNSGNIILTGIGGNTSGRYNVGVEIDNSGTVVASDGDIEIHGSGGGYGSATESIGIRMDDSTSLTTTGVGNISLFGTGGHVSGFDSVGIEIEDFASISTDGGSIDVLGIGNGHKEASNSDGIRIQDGAELSTLKRGDISMRGFGGYSSGGSNRGIQLGWNKATISTVNGNAYFFGTGGGVENSENNPGLVFHGDAKVYSTGSGVIELNGVRGNSPSGSESGVAIRDSSINANTGDIIIEGNGGVVLHRSELDAGLSGNVQVHGFGGISSGYHQGIGLSEDTIVTSKDGNISFYAEGGSCTIEPTGYCHGIGLHENAMVKSTGVGNISFVGSGGNGVGPSNIGITISGESIIQATDGTIVLDGTGGGAGNSRGNYGIGVFKDAEVLSIGTGDIFLEGAGGIAQGDVNFGVAFHESASLSTTNGDAYIEGIGGGTGTSSINTGVVINANSEVTLGNLSDLSIIGHGGLSKGQHNHGASLSLSNEIVLNGGQLSIYGLGGHADVASNHVGVVIGEDTKLSSLENGGDIDIAFSSMWVYDTAIIESHPDNLIQLEARTGSDRPGAIMLRHIDKPHPWPHSTAAILWEPVLDRFFTPNLIIGGEYTSNIYIDGESTRSELTNITFQADNSIEITEYGSIDTAGGSLNMVSDGTVSFKPRQTTVDIVSGDLNLSESSALEIVINGTTENRLYEQLQINGEVTVFGGLLLSGEYEPEVGESFTIINNDGGDAVVGTFNGLPEGGLVAFNDVPLQISYSGGSGNDVTLTAVAHSPGIDPISDLIISEDADEQTVSLTGISAASSDNAPLRILAESDNPDLIDSIAVEYTSPNSTGKLKFTPEEKMAGVSEITVTVEDGGLDEDLSTTSDNAINQTTFEVYVVESHPWHNYKLPEDVNGDGEVTPVDALSIINEINRSGAGSLPADRTAITPPYYDVSKDGSLSPFDALLVINDINAANYMMSMDVSFTNAAGAEISEVETGSVFYLTLSSTDLSDLNEGVFAAYADVFYDTNMVSTAGTAHFVDPYSNGKSIDTALAGIINEWGAFGGVTPPDSSRVIISRIPMSAKRVGAALFAVDAADESPIHDALLYSSAEPISIHSIRFGSKTLEIIEAAEGEFEETVDSVFRDY